MRAKSYEQRPTGIESVGEIPWGVHFCVLHASAAELLDVLVPFVKAGLESGELCSWEVRAPLTVEGVTSALEVAVPQLSTYAALGQIEIVSARELAAPGEALERRLDQAILAGFEGLRLVRHADFDAQGAALDRADSFGALNVIAAFPYPRAELGAVGLMQVVQHHRFALVCNSGRWEVLEGSEARTARDALARTEEKLQSLFSNMSEGFAYHRIVLDAEGKPCDYVFLEVNAAFERLTGLVAENIVGKRVTQALPGTEKDPSDWIGKYGRVALTGEPLHFESYSEVLDKWYAVSAFSPYKGYFAANFADITDRKRAEAERRAAEERLSVTLRSIGDAVIATDTEGRVTLMNGVAESLTGWSEAEARGKALGEVFRIIDEESGAPAQDPVQKVLEHGTVVGLTNHTALVTKSGQRVAIDDSAAPVRSGQRLLGVVLVFRDVSAERRAERERELTIEFLRLVNANVRTDDLVKATVTYFQERWGCEAVALRLKDGEDFPYREARGFSEQFLRMESRLCARDARGDVQRDSSGAPVLECRCGDVICGSFESQSPTLSEGGSFWANEAAELLAATPNVPRNARLRGRCAEEGYESVALVPLRVGNQRLGLLQVNDRRKGMFRPETIALWERLVGHFAVALARSRAEEELSRANQQLKESDRLKNDFLAMLSHELRNPLAPISNSLYVLERTEPGGSKSKHAKEVIDRQVRHMSRLVDDLLDVTRISRNKIQLRRERVELCDLVRRSVEDQRSVFERGGVELELALPHEALFVHADPIRIAQVIGNLLQNAAKFTPRGGRARVSVWEDLATERAVIRVTDTGVGIAPGTLERVFQPFMQADQTLDRSKGGLGLGLALVKGLIELHGGEVHARSDGLDRGAELVVMLPLAVGEELRARSIHPPPPRVPKRVLIIEDNVDAADSLREVLELSGHEVSVAYSGSEGIERARELRPEVVLCDIGLPGMDGYEVARKLRDEASLAGTRLVALSGYALAEDLQRALGAGFERHLAKPPGIPALLDALDGRA